MPITVSQRRALTKRLAGIRLVKSRGRAVNVNESDTVKYALAAIKLARALVGAIDALDRFEATNL